MNGQTQSLALDRAFALMAKARADCSPGLIPQEVGFVANVSTGVAQVRGLPGVGFEELVSFADGTMGIAFSIDVDEVGVVLLGEAPGIRAGDQVQRTGRVTDVPVGDALLGRVVDPLGRPLDDGPPLPQGGPRLPVERDAKPIMDRAPVSTPLQTGIKAIDALVPMGRGQRELILGDRQTGKSAVALDTILSQRGEDVICVYCAIGQRASAVAQVVAKLSEAGALEYCVIVDTEGNDAPGLQYNAP